MIIKKFEINGKIRKFHCYTACPKEAGIELFTIVNNAVKDLNNYLDDIYNIYRKHFPKLTRPTLYVYIQEDDVGTINAFTDGISIYISVGAMIGLHTYICERLDTKKFNGEELVPEFIKGSLPLQLYKYILELMVSHELVHIWHCHKQWKSTFLKRETTAINFEESIFSEKVLPNLFNSDEDCIKIEQLSIDGGYIVCKNKSEENFIQQILEIDADCSAMCITLASLYEEMKSLVTSYMDDNGKTNKISSIMQYNSLLLGLRIGAAGIMFGFLDSREIGATFKKLNNLLKYNHPIHSIRFVKTHATLNQFIYQMYKDETIAKSLLSYSDIFSVDIFIHKDNVKDIKNCFWVSAQTREAQAYITLLEKGWNLIHDSLQQISSMDIASKFTFEDLLISNDMIWFDKDGNSIIQC